MTGPRRLRSAPSPPAPSTSTPSEATSSPTRRSSSSFPALEYDSFFAAPAALFDNVNPGFASGPVWTDTTVSATWFDTPDTGDGTYTLARFTILAPGGSAGTLVGSSTA